MSTFTVTPIRSDEADVLRTDIKDGRLAARRVVLDEDGVPCRQCLQPGQVGDDMFLFTYQPFRGESPYTVASPVFLHVEACGSYADTARLPELVRSGQRNVRSYDIGHDLIDGEVASGDEVELAIERLFKNEDVAYIHLYSATAGCFTCRVDRP